MKIATRTAFMYTVCTAAILLLFAYSVIFITERNQQEEFFDRLGYKLTWRSEFYFDAGVTEDIIRLLHKRNQQLLNEADVSIYDEKYQLLFSDVPTPLGSDKLWNKLQTHKRVKWIQDDMQYMAESYYHKNKRYYVVGRAKDLTGEFYMQRLKYNIYVICIVSLVLVFIVGFVFSYYTIKPIKNIIAHIRDISEHQLHKRLVVPKAKDELYELTETFNTTFNRLEQSFNNHRKFVTTISHEFRTPLAALIAELQLAKELNTTLEEYKVSVDNALQDAQKATDLSSALLDLARASYDISQISFVPLRLDELLMDAQLSVIGKNPSYKVKISYQAMQEVNQEEMEGFEMNGNPYLLLIAFVNLMENACKYAQDEQCIVTLIQEDTSFVLQFKDKGIGISLEDQAKIFDLFYRGTNQKYNTGNGVGLSIVQQIVALHKGEIKVQSTIGEGSCFCIKLSRG